MPGKANGVSPLNTDSKFIRRTLPGHTGHGGVRFVVDLWPCRTSLRHRHYSVIYCTRPGISRRYTLPSPIFSARIRSRFPVPALWTGTRLCTTPPCPTAQSFIWCTALKSGWTFPSWENFLRNTRSGLENLPPILSKPRASLDNCAAMLSAAQHRQFR